MDKWNREVGDRFNGYISALYFPVSGLGTGTPQLKGHHPAIQLNSNGETAYISGVIPHSIADFREVGIRIIGTTTGLIDYTVNLEYGAVGEANDATARTATENGYAVTDGRIQEISLPLESVFDDLTGGDQIGVEIVLDGLTTTTAIHVLGLYLKYF